MLATEIIAHRGLSSLFPENTMVAVKAAAKVGATWIETDVQILKDGTPIIFHDHEMGRVTAEQGQISSYTEEEIKRIDIGSWYDEKFQKERIPLLREMLDLIDELNMGMNLEIKYHKGYHDALAKEDIAYIIECINKELMISPQPPRGILITSFFFPFLEEMRAIHPNIALGCLYTDYEENYLDKAMSINPKSINFAKEILLDVDTKVAEQRVKEIKDAGLDLYVYTVNKKEDVSKLFSFGVDGVITDCPQKFERYLP